MGQASKPHLRPLDFQPVIHQGERMWLLRDPWELSDRQLIFPPALAGMLHLCDGTRTPEQIHADFSAQIGAQVPFTIIAEAIAELDSAHLLQNDRFERKRSATLDAFRAQAYRPPTLADLSYPGSVRKLDALFHQYGNGVEEDGSGAWRGRGVVSPHIDYQRGGPVYARVWHRATPAVLQADLVLIFGTDHNGSPGSITLTGLPYATPYGVLPTDPRLVVRLAESIGPQAAYAEELNHRREHSIELSAVWLHHVFHRAGAAPCPMIPILVGSFHHYLSNGAHPADNAIFNRFLETLRAATTGFRVLAVASVDLAHVGPAFGDAFIMDEARRNRLRKDDRKLVEAALRGDSADYYRQIWSAKDRNRICGFAPLYLMLRFLETDAGQMVAYDQCPADPADHSLVSICGLLLD